MNKLFRLLSICLFSSLLTKLNCAPNDNKYDPLNDPLYGFVEIYNNTNEPLIIDFYKDGNINNKIIDNKEISTSESGRLIGTKNDEKKLAKPTSVGKRSEKYILTIKKKGTAQDKMVAKIEISDLTHQSNVFIDIKKAGNEFKVIPYTASTIIGYKKSRGDHNLTHNITSKSISKLKIGLFEKYDIDQTKMDNRLKSFINLHKSITNPSEDLSKAKDEVILEKLKDDIKSMSIANQELYEPVLEYLKDKTSKN